MHLHCRFYLQTDSDINFHCRFYLKTGSDVHAPLYKTNRRPHTSIPPTHELSQSHFSCFTLTSQEIHSLYVIWSWLLHFSMVLICCLLQYSIYIHLIYIYIHVSLHSTFIYMAPFAGLKLGWKILFRLKKEVEQAIFKISERGHILIPYIRSIFNYVATFYL